MKILLVILLTSVFIVSSAQAAEKAEYKCFVDGKLGEQIVFYRWKVAEFEMKVRTLVGRYNRTTSGNKYIITAVMECTRIEEDFTNMDAKALDAVTLR